MIAILAYLMLSADPSRGAGGAPKIKCEIELASWCIATFDGAISMEDKNFQRVWKLQARTGMEDGPLEIVESKSCSDEAETNLSKLSDLIDGKYKSIKYRVTTSGCELEFRWPANASDASTYVQVIHYGILVGGGKNSQLYEVR